MTVPKDEDQDLQDLVSSLAEIVRDLGDAMDTLATEAKQAREQANHDRRIFAQAMNAMQSTIAATLTRIDAQQSQLMLQSQAIQNLQTENRRLLEQYLGKNAAG